MIQLIKGFKDILPGETEYWQYAVNIAVGLFHNFGYREIYTPIMEKADLFARSIGKGTDIVEKEMYTFPDRNMLLTLRPEATASIVRAYIQHKMYSSNSSDTRLYTFGPMFRRERPQKGRYRQFYQMDVEIFGVKSAYADAELIFMLHTLLARLSVGHTIVHLNSLGCFGCRPFFKSYLIDRIYKISERLCVNCNRRKKHNPLRVLDCKIESCREAMQDIKTMIDFLCDDCRKHFDALIDLLCELDVPFKLDRYLVRGLDYYTRTTFEIHHNDLGAQSAVAGGGRYDGLVKALGGPDTPAVGFAVGFNRLLEIMDSDFELFHPDLFIAVLGKAAMKLAFVWKIKLSSEGLRVKLGKASQGLKSQMKQANSVNASYVLIVGEQEIKNGEVLLRHMGNGSQFCISLDNILIKIREEFARVDPKFD